MGEERLAEWMEDVSGYAETWDKGIEGLEWWQR